MYKTQRVRDPLHNLIQIGGDQFEDAMWEVVQTRPFQRLRRIKQLGVSELVYPGATHSRFAHSLGVFHTARLLMARAQQLTQGWKPIHAQHALAAALVHDVGHGPFSHAFESVGKRLSLANANHEHMSDLLIRNSEISATLDKHLGHGFSTNVANVIKNGPGDIYSAVVSSQFDADRLDYMRRDRMMTGTEHGAIDFNWMIANLEIENVPYGVDEEKLGEVETFVLGPKALHAAETYVLALFQLYPTVYFHKATRGAEKILGELLYRVIKLVQDGSTKKTGLPQKHPLVVFAKESKSVDAFLDLDDAVLWGALTLLENSEDQMVSNLAERLKHRRLFKCIDIREAVIKKLGDGTPETGIEQMCLAIEQKIEQWLVEQPDLSIRILSDRAYRMPYRPIQESKGPLNQILIKTPSGELVDIVKRSKVVKAIDTYTLYRVYVSDECARNFVEQTIETEGESVTRNC